MAIGKAKNRNVEGLEGMSIWDRVEYKVKHEINSFGPVERCKMEERLNDAYQVKVFEMSDEQLIQEAKDRGVIL